uniref:Breast cancer type 1 susceptibility-like protein n=1 Tax=Magallana gigas TaxID=29159 RepID=K1PR58_MAGGI
MTPTSHSFKMGKSSGKEDIQVEDTSRIDPPFLNSASCGKVAGPCSCIAEEDNGTTGSQLDDIHIIVSGKSTLAEKEVAKRHMKFSKTITHVVMITDSKNFICDRTMKYIQGIAHGCWVLSSEWLYKSLEAGFLLPEEKYVIRGDTVSGEEAIGPRNPMSASEAATGVLQAMSIYLHGFNERSKISRGCKHIYGISTATLSWLMDCIAEQKLHSPSDYLAAGDVEKKANEDTPNNENSAWIPKKDDGDIGEDSEEMQCYEEDGAYAYDDSDENMEDPDWIPGKSDEDDDGKNNEDNDITETEDLVGAFVVGMREKNKQDIAQDWIPGTSEEDDDNDDDFEKEVVVPNIGVTCNNKILLQMARQTTKGRSAKQNICYYCEKPYSRISRHLIQVHNKEMEIAKILSFPKKSKERKTLWKEIVNKGNYKHNYDVMKNGNGEIVPKYRPRNTTNNPEPENCFSSYAPCEFCLGSYKKTDLWKHQKNCELKSSEKRSKANPIQMGKLLLPIVGTSKGFYENIFIKMRDDAVKLEIQKDPLVLQFAERLYEKNGANLHQHQYISQRLRELGRLLIQLKSDQTEITSIRTAINPINWDTLIHSIKTLAGLDEKKNTYKTPSLPLKLGHSLSKCAKILKTNAIIEENDADRKIADNFLTLYQSDWEERISAHALATLHNDKFNKPLLVPLAEDVVLLNSYLCTSAASLKESLKNGVDETKYSELAEVCLAQIILFNRKRSGEAARITINQYNEGLTNKPLNKEIEKSLSKFENELCKSHTRIEIKGKRGSKVPILLTSTLKDIVTILLKARKALKIDSEFIFIKPRNSKPIRGSDCLRKFSVNCGAKCPKLLTSTKLRKHLATMCQVLELSESNQDILAKFMGHDIRVHREFYRLPDSTLELAKVAKVLHLINTGEIAKYKNKDFDEIEFDNAGTSSNGGRHHWLSSEKNAIERQFSEYFKSGQTPGRLACLNAIAKEPILSKHDWSKIKHAVRNMITSQKRKQYKT